MGHRYKNHHHKDHNNISSKEFETYKKEHKGHHRHERGEYKEHENSHWHARRAHKEEVIKSNLDSLEQHQEEAQKKLANDLELHSNQEILKHDQIDLLQAEIDVYNWKRYNTNESLTSEDIIQGNQNKFELAVLEGRSLHRIERTFEKMIKIEEAIKNGTEVHDYHHDYHHHHGHGWNHKKHIDNINVKEATKNYKDAENKLSIHLNNQADAKTINYDKFQLAEAKLTLDLKQGADLNLIKEDCMEVFHCKVALGITVEHYHDHQQLSGEHNWNSSHYHHHHY